MNESRRNSFLEQGYTVMEMYECEWWHLYKSNDIVKQHLPETFTLSSIDPYLVRSSVILKFSQDSAKTLPTSPIFKNDNKSKDDIGSLMKSYTE